MIEVLIVFACCLAGVTGVVCVLYNVNIYNKLKTMNEIKEKR